MTVPFYGTLLNCKTKKSYPILNRIRQLFTFKNRINPKFCVTAKQRTTENNDLLRPAAHAGFSHCTMPFQSTPPSQGATAGRAMIHCKYFVFQSTPPSQGATDITDYTANASFISIHAPFAGGDQCQSMHRMRQADFNPRPLRRGRHITPRVFNPTVLFQSTPPSQGATRWRTHLSKRRVFQSTPPSQGATFH